MSHQTETPQPNDPEQTHTHKMHPKPNISTGGGSYNEGNVTTDGGDFSGRDKIDNSGSGAIATDGGIAAGAGGVAAREIRGNIYFGQESPEEKAERARRHQQKLQIYRERVKNRTEHLKLRGVPIRGAANLTIPLTNVYIQIQALDERSAEELRRSEEAAAVGHTEEKAHQRKYPQSFLDIVFGVREYMRQRDQRLDKIPRAEKVNPVDALEKHQKLVLLGAPGAGKSTFMDYLAHRYASKQELFPIQVSLGAYAAELQNNSTLELRKYALQEAAAGDKELQMALEVQVEEENVIWLLDGLDEAYERRDLVSERAGSLPGKVIITSRRIGYSRFGRSYWKHFEVLPLSTENVDKFIHDWLITLANINNKDKTWIDECISNLKDQLSKHPHLLPLTHTPLLLTFMVILAGEKRGYQLPNSRAQLYEEFLNRLYIIHEAERYPLDDLIQKPSIRLGQLTQEKARRVIDTSLNLLAYYLQLGFNDTVEAVTPERKTLIPLVANGLQILGQASESNMEALAEEAIRFWEMAGLIEERKWDEWWLCTFQHLTFQEYSVARLLNKMWKQNPDVTWLFLKTRLHRPAWREPILLFISITDGKTASNFVEHLLEGTSPYENLLHRDLQLAAACIGENPNIDKYFVDLVTKRLIRYGRGLLAPQMVYQTAIFVTILIMLWLPLIWLPDYWRLAAALLSVMWMLLWLGFEKGNMLRLQTFLFYPLPYIGQAPMDLSQVIISLTLMCKGTVDPLIAAVGISDRNVHLRVPNPLNKLVGYISRSPFTLFAIALSESRWDISWRAAEALDKLGDARGVELMAAALSNPRVYVRQRAAAALGQLSNVRAVEPLIAALSDYWWVGWRAAEALGKLGDVRAVEPLIAALDHSDATVHRRAIEALGKLGDVRAVEPLIAALDHSNFEIHLAAVLSKLGYAHRMEKWLAIHSDSRLARHLALIVDKLVDSRRVKKLNSVLSSRNLTNAAYVATALGQLGDGRAVEPLIVVLGATYWSRCLALLGNWIDHDEVKLSLLLLPFFISNGRNAAAVALGKLGDSRAVEPLIAALADSEVRSSAAVALGKLGDSRAVEPLIAALGHLDTRARLDVIATLNQQSAALARVVRITDLGDSGSEVYLRSIEILGQMDMTLAIDYLVFAFGNFNSEMHWLPAKALDKLGYAALMRLVALQDDSESWVRLGVQVALNHLGDAAMTWLISALNDSNSTVRWRATKALGKLGDRRSVEPLIIALSDSDSEVRSSAAIALGKLGDSQAVEPLTIALSHSHSTMRSRAVEALGMLGDSRAVEPLIGVLGDSDSEVRSSAAEALGMLSTEMSEELLSRVIPALVRQVFVKTLVHKSSQALESVIIRFKVDDEVPDIVAFNQSHTRRENDGTDSHSK